MVLRQHRVSGQKLMFGDLFPCFTVSNLDLNALAGMNDSATVFYRGLAERMEGVSNASQHAFSHADNARRVSHDMESVSAAAKRLEALVERLDEYTIQLESRLRKVRPGSPQSFAQVRSDR